MSRAIVTPVLATLALGAAAIAPILTAIAPAKSVSVPANTGVATTPTTASGGGVTVTATPDRTAVLESDRRLRVRLDLDAAALEGAAPRVPTDLVVVLDRSGSMDGDKILDAKAAARELVGQLGPDDRFALVSFSSDVRVDLPLSHASAADRLATIERLSAGGGTAMDAGLRSGLDVFGPRTDRARRVALISDGLPDTRDRLDALATDAARHESPLTTVGIGMDYDEVLMQRLADLGTGNFHWVERGPQLAAVLGDELNTARETTATGVQVSLASDTGARIVEASGYPVENGQLFLGSLFAGQHRSLWVTVELDPGVKPGTVDPGAFRVRWQDAVGVSTDATVDLAAVEVTPRTDVFLANVDADSWAEVTVEEDYNKLRSAVSAAVQRGDVADAERRIQAYRDEKAQMNATLGSTLVADNLNEVDALAREVQVQAANPRHVQNAWSKGVSNSAYQQRRSGQSKSW